MQSAENQMVVEVGGSQYTIRRFGWSDVMSDPVLRRIYGFGKQAQAEPNDFEDPEDKGPQPEAEIDNVELIEAVVRAGVVGLDTSSGFTIDPVDMLELFGQVWKFNGLNAIKERVARFRDLFADGDLAREGVS